jgi:hypothetical protein
MINLLFSAPPVELEVDGELYPINHDYRTGLRVIMAFQDNTLLSAEKTSVLLENVYAETVPDDLGGAIKEALWFIDCGITEEQQQSPHRLYSFEKDANIIYAAFQQTHGIDLSMAEDLHWWKFVALLMDTGQDTTFTQLIALRKRVKTGKASKEEIKLAREMGDMFIVEDYISPEQRAEKDKFMQNYRKAKQARDAERRETS